MSEISSPGPKHIPLGKEPTGAQDVGEVEVVLTHKGPAGGEEKGAVSTEMGEPFGKKISGASDSPL
jgi:hypothetical protein